MSTIDTRLLVENGNPAIPVDPAVQPSGNTGGVRGYGGWLAFFCGVQIYLAPILTAFRVLLTLGVVGMIADHYPGLALAAVIEGVVAVCFTVWGFRVAQALRVLRPEAVRDVKALLRGKLTWAFAALFLPALTEMPGEVFVGAIRDLLVALVGFGIWYTYFCVSERVRASFPG